MVSSLVSRPRRLALLAALVGLACLLAAALLLYLSFPSLLGSPRSLRFVEGYLSEKVGRPVALGALEYLGAGRFVARDLSVGEGDPPSANLPRVELRVTVPGLWKGRVGEILLEGPDLLVGPPAGAAGGRVPVLPPVDKVLVTGGTLRFRDDGGEDLVLGPFSASFETTAGGEVVLKGRTALPFLETPLSFETRLDPARLTFSGGELSVGDVRLSPLAGGYPLEGTADLRARIITAGEGEATLDVRGDLRDVTLTAGGVARGAFAGELQSRVRLSNSYRLVDSSGTLTLRGRDSPGDTHELRYDGSFDREGGTLTVRSLDLSSPPVGRITASGSASSLTGPRPPWELAIRTEGLRVPALLAALGARTGGESLPTRATIQSELRARGEGASSFSATGEARCPDLVVPPGSAFAFLNGRPLRAKVSLAAFPEGARWDLERLELFVGELPPFRLRGRLRDAGGPSVSVDGVLEVPTMPLAALRDLLGDRAPPGARALAADGDVRATVEILGPPGALLLSGTGTLQGQHLGYGALKVSPISAEGSFRYGKGAGDGDPTLSGTVSLQGRSLEHGTLRADPFSAEGSFRYGKGAGDGDPTLSGTVSLQGRSLEHGTLRADPFSAEGSFRYGKRAGDGDPTLSGTMSLQGQGLGYGALKVSPFSAEGSFGYGKRAGNGDPTLSGTVSLQGRSLEHGTLRADPFSADVSFSRGPGAGPSGEFRITAGEVALAGDDAPPRPLGGVSLDGGYSLDPAGLPLGVEKGVLHLAGLPNVSFSGRLSGAPEPSLALTLALSPAEIAPFSPRIAALLPLPEGFSLSGKGRLVAEFTVLPHGGGGYRARGSVVGGLDGGGFSSPEGSRAAEGAALEVTAALDVLLPEGDGTVEAKGRLGGFELLLGGFYGNFRERALDFRVSGRTGGVGAPLTVEEFDAVLEGLAEAHFRGTAAAGQGGLQASGRLAAEITSHRDFFDFFLRDTFGDRFPWIAGLEPEGRSRAEVDFSYRRGEGYTIEGDLRVAGAALRSPEPGFVLRGLDLELPLRLSTVKGVVRAGSPSTGTLRWEEVSWEGIGLPPGGAAPTVFGNDLVFRGDIDLPLLDGRLVLRDVACLDLLGPGRTVRLSADARGLLLAPLFSALGLPPVEGTLEGRLDSVTYRNGELRAAGELSAKVFGGTVTVKDLSADRLWSPVPSFGLTLSLQDILLAEVTGAFEFGHISGVLEGAVKDLVIAAGEPQSFEARLESVKRRGVEQKISVEALEKISILGSGKAAGVLSRGIYQFFKEYRYDKMGFSASLRNDHLRLNGVHQEGDRTYLVKGGVLPPKADVITYSQNIAFRDMADRLRRIGRDRMERGKDR